MAYEAKKIRKKTFSTASLGGNMDAQTHMQRIDEAIAELLAFHLRTAAPAPIPHQYVGTIIDNTVGLLTAPANSLDGGTRSIKFENPQNWLSLMQAVHRSFFSSVMSAVELGLTHLCATHNFSVTSKQGDTLLSKVQELQNAAAAACIELPVLGAIEKHFSGYRPVFGDYLEAVLGPATLSTGAKKQWRAFFRALSIVRNKVSHSDASLSENERAELVSGGCEVMVTDNGELVINPRMYAQVAEFVLQFFDELGRALSPSVSSNAPAA